MAHSSKKIVPPTATLTSVPDASKTQGLVVAARAKVRDHDADASNPDHESR